MQFRNLSLNNWFSPEMEIIRNSTYAETNVARILRMLRTRKIQEYLEDPEHDRLKIVYYTDIVLPTGRIVGSDALIFQNEPYLGRTNPGKYPVYLYIYQHNNDQRIAYAEIRFTSSEPASFLLARTEKNRHEDLKEGEYVGFGVDTGTACLMDAEVTARIAADASLENDCFERLENALDQDSINTFSKANIAIPGTKGNIVAFSSGYGDGVYGAYWCLNKFLKLCSILIDFNVIEIPELGQQPRTWMWEETDVLGRSNRQRAQQGLPPIDGSGRPMLLCNNATGKGNELYQLTYIGYRYDYVQTCTQKTPDQRKIINLLLRRRQAWMQYSEQNGQKSIPEYTAKDTDDADFEE